jgi:hypothetical protein
MYEAIPMNAIETAPNGGYEEIIRLLISFEAKRNMIPMPVIINDFLCSLSLVSLAAIIPTFSLSSSS